MKEMKIEKTEIIEGIIKDGDIFTISGLRLKKNGKIDRNCKSGKETKFIARIVDKKDIDTFSII
jgi:hypothetical protein